MGWRRTSKSNKYEHILLIVVASIGLAGSLFVFSECPDAQVSSVHTGTINKAEIERPAISLVPFSELVEIKGELVEQNKLRITWIARKPNARYTLDMGNGERVMLRGDKFNYTYDSGGDYLLELREIENDLITTISTHRLHIAKRNLFTSVEVK